MKPTVVTSKKAELLKALEPFSNDTLVVIAEYKNGKDNAGGRRYYKISVNDLGSEPNDRYPVCYLVKSEYLGG